MAKIIGLTGGIASGKSTVVAYLRQKSYVVIDADALVHQLQMQGGRLYQVLVEWLGRSILTETGDLDRQKLSQLIFSSEENLAISSRLQNQIIREELAKERDRLAQTESLFFMDIPLLYELGYESWFSEVWLVYVSQDIQLERLMTRNGYSREEAQLRLSKQLSLESKKNLAQVVIDNRGQLAETYAQIDQILSKEGRKDDKN